MEVFINKGKNISSELNLNFLAKHENVYLMDNHLAAFWCWSRELDPLQNYQLIHIDRHHDLEDTSVQKGFHLYKTADFKTMDPEKLLGLQVGDRQMLRWDNFIELYNAFNPLNFNGFTFVTPDSAPGRYARYGHEPLEQWVDEALSNTEVVHFKLNPIKTLVLNLDIDVFFKDDKSHSPVLPLEKMEAFAAKFRQLMDMSFVITIALSPECCGGWEKSIDKFNAINELLGLDFNLSLL